MNNVEVQLNAVERSVDSLKWEVRSLRSERPHLATQFDLNSLRSSILMWLVIGAPIFMAIMLLIPDAAIDRRVSGQDRSTQVGARHEIEARESHTPAVEITPAPSPRT